MKHRIIFTLVLILDILIANGQFNQNIRIQKHLSENGNSSEILGFFVKGEKQSIINLCTKHNGKYHSSVKGWHYVKVPANDLNEFSLSKHLENLHISLYPGTTHNDTMRVNNKINDIHTGAGALQSSYSGKDVVMGFIDTGLDWSHGDFKNADGSTRIIALWDHTLSNSSNTPVDYGYGQEWDSIGINQGLATAHTDYSGHGTTVTGTGAGNGLANGTHKGVANESDIIAVEIDFNSANFLGSIVDATEYIYNIADSMGKPCVINGSLGTYFGSHDGLDPYSLYIDSLINEKKGRLFVCSAGNSGNWGAYHLHADVNNDTTFTWFKPHSNYNYLFIELWADTGAFNQLEFCLGADMHTPYYSFRGSSQYLNILNHLNTVTYDTIKNSNNDAIASVQYYAEQMDGQYLLQVYIPYVDSSNYYYRFQTKGTGAYDIWSEQAHLDVSDIIPEELIPSSALFPEIIYYSAPDTLSTLVSSFQCLPSVITVGNYTNDSGYVNNLGNWVSSNTTRGSISPNTSKGPTRIGLQKPDIAASGDITLSACRLDFLPFLDDSVLAYGGLHKGNGGTSMSSPVIAGIAALFLEKCNLSTPQQFKEAIINSAYTDAFTGTVPNYAVGYGKVDGFNTLVSTSFSPTIQNNEFCLGQDSAEVRTVLNYSQYNWSSGDTIPNSIYLPNTNEYLIVTDSSGCKSDTVFFDIIEHPLPIVPTITISFDELITDPGYDNYQWYINGTLLNGENDSTLQVILNGFYEVEVFDQNNCSNISGGIFYGAVHVNENENEISLYPIPSKKEINLISNKELLSIEIINSNGQIVKTLNGYNSINHTKIDISSLSNGIYFMKINTNDGLSVKKFHKH